MYVILFIEFFIFQKINSNFVFNDILTEFNRRDESDNELSEVDEEVIPEEVRKWLASTFTKTVQPKPRLEPRPRYGCKESTLFCLLLYFSPCGCHNMYSNYVSWVYAKLSSSYTILSFYRSPFSSLFWVAG